MIVAGCPLCKTDARLLFRIRDMNHRISREKFNYYRCQSCDLIFLLPIPANLGEYYPKQYYSMPASLEQLEAGAEGDRYKLEIVRRFAASGRLLEIGPAYGGFALLAKKAGYSVETIEMDPQCCDFLEKVAGIKAIHSSEPAAALKGGAQYNVITLWHVLEHLPDPWGSLEMIAKSLVPGGILILAAPNPRSFQFKVLGRFWPHVDAPRHVELIPLPLIERQLTAHGLDTVWTTTTDKGTLGWNVFGWEVFFANWSNHRFLKRRLRKIGRLISRIFGPLDRMRNYGSAYTAVFRKR